MMGKKGIELKRVIETKDIITYLEALVESFKKGQIMVEQGDKSVHLNPPPVVKLEIEAKQKKEKEKFAFEISWAKNDPVRTHEDIKITSNSHQSASEGYNGDDA
jgi:amphi-Trp domain-containing protein